MSAKNRYLIKRLVQFSAILVVFLSVFPYLIHQVWWIDIFSNFQMQYLILMFPLLVFFALKKKGVWVLLLGIGITFSCYRILPLYINTSTEAKASKEELISLTSINLLSTNRNHKAVADFITDKNPDVLVLSEYTPYWDRELLETLNSYPYKHKVIREDNFGIGVWSKIPSIIETIYFSEYQLPSVLLNATESEAPFSLIATHPFPPVGQGQFELRNNQLDSIARFLNKKKLKNAVVIGDLNTSSFSRNFQFFKEKSALKDSRDGFGILPSWPTNAFIFQTTLDHALVSKNIEVMKREVGRNIGSDHLPIYLEICLE